MRLLAAISLVVLLAGGALAFEYETSRGIGMGRALLLSEMNASSLVSMPLGGIKPNGWQVELGYNRRYELSELDRIHVVGAYRYDRFISAIGVSQYGESDLYTESILKWSLGYQYDSVVVGVALSGMMIDIGNDYGTLRAATFGASAAYRHELFVVAASGDNLTSPKPFEDSEPYDPMFSLYGEYRGKESFSVLLRATWQNEQSPQFALGQRIRLSTGSAFFWGIGTQPIEYGGGVELQVSGAVISYATSIHPVLGFSHTVSVAYGSRRPKPTGGDEFD